MLVATLLVMPQIFVLPEHIASQIAAGEVVERPASVVKELVENSIDAGASKIVVDVGEDCRYIRVADNGCGMSAADASLAFQRHATSKLRSANDLWNLNTLGFRGEALPSIAAVSKLICCTRMAQEAAGTKVTCADGEMSVSETGCAPGTIIEVNELFYNVPARLSFLKKASTEFAHILDIMQSLAICYPAVAFELSFASMPKLLTSGLNGLDGAISECGFFNTESSIISLAGKDGVLGIEVEGRLISPTAFRGDRKGIMTVVNKRPVRCALTYRALDYAYADLIPRGRYPLAVVHLSVNPSELDINIHPTKKEIRYSRGNDVYLFLQRQIVNALRGRKGAIDFRPQAESQIGSKDQDALKEGENRFASNFYGTDFYAKTSGSQLSLRESALLDRSAASNDSFEGDFNGAGVASVLDGSSVLAEQKILLAPGFGAPFDANLQKERPTLPALPLGWRLVGYFGNTYILIETENGLSLIEQHIAHERTLYEKILAKTINVESQALVISLPLNLTAEQKSTLEENIEELAQQGFVFEVNDGIYTCLQVPVELAHKDYASIIQSILQELAQSSRANVRLDIVKSLACQAAIKNGMPLATGQIIELIYEWNATQRNDTCPHGRPIKLDFSYEKLFQLFHPA